MNATVFVPGPRGVHLCCTGSGRGLGAASELRPLSRKVGGFSPQLNMVFFEVNNSNMCIIPYSTRRRIILMMCLVIFNYMHSIYTDLSVNIDVITVYQEVCRYNLTVLRATTVVLGVLPDGCTPGGVCGCAARLAPSALTGQLLLFPPRRAHWHRGYVDAGKRSSTGMGSPDCLCSRRVPGKSEWVSPCAVGRPAGVSEPGDPSHTKVRPVPGCLVSGSGLCLQVQEAVS